MVNSIFSAQQPLACGYAKHKLVVGKLGSASEQLLFIIIIIIVIIVEKIIYNVTEGGV